MNLSFCQKMGLFSRIIGFITCTIINCFGGLISEDEWGIWVNDFFKCSNGLWFPTISKLTSQGGLEDLQRRATFTLYLDFSQLAEKEFSHVQLKKKASLTKYSWLPLSSTFNSPLVFRRGLKIFVCHRFSFHFHFSLQNWCNLPSI